jgi:hypothetical protein
VGWGRAGVGSRGGMRTRHREDLSIDAGKGTGRGEAWMVGAGREYELHENIHDHAKTTLAKKDNKKYLFSLILKFWM